MSYFLLRVLFFLAFPAFPMESMPADISNPAVDFGFEYSDDQIKTRPLTENHQDLWASLNDLYLVCKNFRDGKTHTEKEIRYQFMRSLERHKNGDPHYLHVIEMNIDHSVFVTVGTVVLCSSNKQSYLEAAIMMHPCLKKDMSFITQDKDIDTASTADEMKNALSKTDYIPIWNKGIGTILFSDWIKKCIPNIRKCKVQYQSAEGQSISFDGKNRFLSRRGMYRPWSP